MQQYCENLTARKTPKKSKSIDETSNYAKPNNKMGANGAIRGVRAGAGTDGEIIEVQGGHIIRATGKKDRHSKVYTSKGPRDRRVRLSAHTAIQFYDVQDRLGYDRPSKAVDWLMKKAKDAIDKLNDSPHQKEIITSTIESVSGSRSIQELEQAFQLQRQLGGEPNGNYIGDSMKSLFPLSSGTSMMEMQSYPHDRISRMGIQSEDLGLSLHTQNMNQRSYSDHELLLSGANSIPFEQNYSKPESWNNIGGGENNRVGFILNPNTIPQQLFGGQNSAAFTQRESLQSNYSNLCHSWNERMLPSVDQQNAQPMLQSALYNIYFGSNFQAPARIHGEEEHSPGSHL